MSASQSDLASLSLARLTFQGGSYDGLSRGGLPHSFGALQKTDGSRFVGEWKEGDFSLGQATRPGNLKCCGQVPPRRLQATCAFCFLALLKVQLFFSSMRITSYMAWGQPSISSASLKTATITKILSRQVFAIYASVLL
jgi:hypothetical protein